MAQNEKTVVFFIIEMKKQQKLIYDFYPQIEI